MSTYGLLSLDDMRPIHTLNADDWRPFFSEDVMTEIDGFARVAETGHTRSELGAPRASRRGQHGSTQSDFCQAPTYTGEEGGYITPSTDDHPDLSQSQSSYARPGPVQVLAYPFYAPQQKGPPAAWRTDGQNQGNTPRRTAPTIVDRWTEVTEIDPQRSSETEFRQGLPHEQTSDPSRLRGFVNPFKASGPMRITPLNSVLSGDRGNREDRGLTDPGSQTLPDLVAITRPNQTITLPSPLRSSHYRTDDHDPASPDCKPRPEAPDKLIYRNNDQTDETIMFCSNTQCSRTPTFNARRLTGVQRRKIEAFLCSIECFKEWTEEYNGQSTGLDRIFRPCFGCPRQHITNAWARLGANDRWPRNCVNVSKNRRNKAAMDRRDELSGTSAVVRVNEQAEHERAQDAEMSAVVTGVGIEHGERPGSHDVETTVGNVEEQDEIPSIEPQAQEEFVRREQFPFYGALRGAWEAMYRAASREREKNRPKNPMAIASLLWKAEEDEEDVSREMNWAQDARASEPPGVELR